MVQYGRLEEHPAWVMILVKVKETKRKKKSKDGIFRRSPYQLQGEPRPPHHQLCDQHCHLLLQGEQLFPLHYLHSIYVYPFHQFLSVSIYQIFSGLQIPNCDRVSFPAKEKLHLVQDLGQKFLRQLSLPHQVYANTHI